MKFSFRIYAALIVMVGLFISCNSGVSHKETQSPSDDLEELATWMTGEFSSKAHSVEDTSYYNISLVMAPIWTDRTDGKWLYVEQALASNMVAPYRQRVYHLTAESDGSYESKIYSLPDPLRFVACWKENIPLKSLTPDSLTIREGCSVFLKKENAAYKGGTNEKDCTSTLRGASYATTEVVIEADKISSWDRGFNSEDEHVWGAENGGYVFEKIRE